jgi:hypothetical protein
LLGGIGPLEETVGDQQGEVTAGELQSPGWLRKEIGRDTERQALRLPPRGSQLDPCPVSSRSTKREGVSESWSVRDRDSARARLVFHEFESLSLLSP